MRICILTVDSTTNCGPSQGSCNSRGIRDPASGTHYKSRGIRAHALGLNCNSRGIRAHLAHRPWIPPPTADLERVPVFTYDRVAFPGAFERAGMNVSMLDFQVVNMVVACVSTFSLLLLFVFACCAAFVLRSLIII